MLKRLEKLIAENAPPVVLERLLGQLPPPPGFQAKPSPTPEKPGCTVADEVLLVIKHLEGLSQGWGGFGLLRESKTRLERAVQAARFIGDSELADALANIASQLPNVHEAASAERVLRELEPHAHKAWQLGANCGKTQAAM